MLSKVLNKQRRGQLSPLLRASGQYLAEEQPESHSLSGEVSGGNHVAPTFHLERKNVQLTGRRPPDTILTGAHCPSRPHCARKGSLPILQPAVPPGPGVDGRPARVQGGLKAFRECKDHNQKTA